jgi:hypothetical protein
MYFLKIILILFTTSLSLTTPRIWADQERPPYPYITVSKSGHYYFKMIPDVGGRQGQYGRYKGTGICYRVTPDEKDEIIWKTKGWFSFNTYLSYDGKYIIRMGDWIRGHEPSDEHLAVAFYKEGEHLKGYSTKDIVKDSSAIRRTVSHYEWLSDEKPKLESHKFTIKTIDNIEYIFDITNGNIISHKK